MSRRNQCDLEAGLRRLHLPTIRRLYKPLAVQAEKENWTYQELLESLVSEEIAHRCETRISRATRKAKFPYLKTIEEFDFNFQASIERKCLGRFLGPELVEEGRNLVLLGKSGRGKTHLAIAIAYKAIQNGYEARFTTAARLLHTLQSAQRSAEIEEALCEFTKADVLVIDELGYLAYGPDAANHLFQVVDERYLQKKPILVTSNQEPASWGKALHDHDLAEAIVDRLMERGEVLRLRGKSYRNPSAAELEAAPQY
jgi:DNA replication protein DnaC